jgi:hypothetical protein
VTGSGSGGSGDILWLVLTATRCPERKRWMEGWSFTDEIDDALNTIESGASVMCWRATTTRGKGAGHEIGRLLED